ncbi:hypothetical protein M413DRAFT_166547 [Hebeloma cylindrosporum]|uniref:Uncharacterized protein n=1 Tax=Hebeloma cylindrosporum TaxID=76867 RepID=A0A0C2YI31_HEBCY|nr:hypothetical protein M413DRAFT_166547 [Hebeloma cylindrosporum h7]
MSLTFSEQMLPFFTTIALYFSFSSWCDPLHLCACILLLSGTDLLLTMFISASSCYANIDIDNSLLCVGAICRITRACGTCGRILFGFTTSSWIALDFLMFERYFQSSNCFFISLAAPYSIGIIKNIGVRLGQACQPNNKR